MSKLPTELQEAIEAAEKANEAGGDSTRLRAILGLLIAIAKLLNPH